MLNWDYEQINSNYRALLNRKEKKDECFYASIRNYEAILLRKCLLKYDNEPLKIRDIIGEYFDYLDDELDDNIAKLIVFLIENSSISNTKHYKLKSISLSDEELIDVANKTFKILGTRYINLFNIILKNNLVKTINDTTNNNDAYGVTYYDFCNKTGYALVNNTCDSNAFSTFNHEVMHIMEIMSNENLVVEEAFLFSEARTIFIDLVTQYEMMMFDKKEQDEYIKTIIYNCHCYTECLNNLIMINYATKFYSDSRFSIKENINSKFGNNAYRNILKVCPSDEVCCYISYIVAVYMFDNYINDKEKGIYLFNASVDNDPRDACKYLDCISFNYKDYDYVKDVLSKYDSLVNIRVRK